MNLISYVKQFGHKSFSELPFNDIDGLILSQLSYVNFHLVTPESGFMKLKTIKGTPLIDNEDFYYGSVDAKNNENSEQEPNINEIYRIFLFNSLETVIKVSSIILPYYHNGYSDLYRTPSGDRYYLVIRPCQETNDNFNRVCGILSEYGTAAKSSYATLAFLDEHLENVITLNAVDVLAKL